MKTVMIDDLEWQVSEVPINVNGYIPLSLKEQARFNHRWLEEDCNYADNIGKEGK